ncbi:MAG: hypothetical protein LCH52_02375 [Bacteroidetes bacterium]|nr:hypothetical protein [Bacteroidota bacterium]
MTGIDQEKLRERLDSIVSKPDENFEQIYSYIVSKDKDQIKNLLVYINRIIDESILKQEESGFVRGLHIHICDLKKEYRSIILSFLVIKFFMSELSSDNRGNSILSEVISRLEFFRNQVWDLDRNPKSIAEINAERNICDKKLRFYREFAALNNNASFVPSVIVNIKMNEDSIHELLDNKPFICEMNGQANPDFSYVLLNRNFSMNDIAKIEKQYGMDGFIIENLKYVVNYDTMNIPKNLHNRWKCGYLQERNNNIRVSNSFKGLMLLSFHNEILKYEAFQRSYKKSLEYLGSIDNLKFVRYTILPQEIQLLLPEESKIMNKRVNVTFIGNANNDSWDDFMYLVELMPGLEKLVGVKMRRLYSLCISEQIKQKILKIVFDECHNQILDGCLRDTIHNLDATMKNEVKESLGRVLTEILKLNWLSEIRKKMRNNNIIILPQFVLNDRDIMDNVKKEFNGQNEFKSIREIEKIERTDTVILEYRDTGPYPFTYTHNVVNSKLRQGKKEAIYLSFLFKSIFEKNIHDNLIEIAKKEDGLFRKGLGVNFKDIVYQNQIYNDFDSTYDDSTEYQNESLIYQVQFSDNSSQNFYPFTYHFYSTESKPGLKINRLNEIEKKRGGEVVKLQSVEEILKEFISEMTSKKEEDYYDFSHLKEVHRLENETDNKNIWRKVLIKNNDADIDVYYNKISELCNKFGFSLVSKHTFISYWMCDSAKAFLPRDKRLFKFLCITVLNLGKDYYQKMRELKKTETLLVKDSNRQLIDILRDLVQDRVMEDETDYEFIIGKNKEKYLGKHDLELIGCYDDEAVEESLISFVNWIKPRIKLKPVDNITPRNKND